MSIWLIVGLGNPGPKYTLTRHNIGFLVVDLLAEGLGVRNWTTQEKALVAKAKWDDNDLMFVKPQTYMNLSGEAVQPLMAYYKIPLEQLIVIHDEVEFDFGKMKFQKNRSPGGHNGIKSIAERLSTQDFIRLRMGVGRSTNPEISTADHVLGRFSKDEEKMLPDYLNRAGDAIEVLLKDGLGKASSLYNG